MRAILSYMVGLGIRKIPTSQNRASIEKQIKNQDFFPENISIGGGGSGMACH